MLRHLIPRRGRLPELHSTGRPVVLLHGTLSSPGNFADLAAALDARGRRVIVPEYGRRGTASLRECIDEVRSILIDAQSQLDIIGHSYGGLVGLLAADCPELQGRIDHIIGLFRLWWVPQGLGPRHGTYVRNNHEALIGILALEAHRAQALVVGEDLGTVEPWVRQYLSRRGILGTSVLWFENDHGRPLDAHRWREYCLASVTTHDLPPTLGYLAGDHVRLREDRSKDGSHAHSPG